MASKKQPKPGVRTKLNSGKNKIKKREGEPSTPNPTAIAGQQNLPVMELAAGDWTVATNSSPLTLALPVSSDRTLGKNILIEVKSEPAANAPSEPKIQKQPRKKKKRISKQNSVRNLPEKKVPYKKKTTKNNKQILSNIKDTITKQVDNMKLDYKELERIQTELQAAANKAQSTIKSNIDKINEYANITIEKTANSEILKPKPKKSKLDINNDKIKPKQKKKEQKPAKTTEQNISKTQNNIEAIKAAYEFAAESQAASQINPKTQELTEAILKRNGAQKAIDSLKARLQYAAEGERRTSIEERIKLKEQQLAEANLLIEKLQNEI